MSILGIDRKTTALQLAITDQVIAWIDNDRLPSAEDLAAFHTFPTNSDVYRKIDAFTTHIFEVADGGLREIIDNIGESVGAKMSALRVATRLVAEQYLADMAASEEVA